MTDKPINHGNDHRFGGTDPTPGSYAYYYGSGTYDSDTNLILTSVDATLQYTTNTKLFKNPTSGGKLAPQIAGDGIFVFFLGSTFLVNVGGSGVGSGLVAQIAVPEVWTATIGRGSSGTDEFQAAGVSGNTAEREANPSVAYIWSGAMLGNVQLTQNSGITMNYTFGLLILQIHQSSLDTGLFPDGFLA